MKDCSAGGPQPSPQNAKGSFQGRENHHLCAHQPAQPQVLIRPHPTRMEVVLITWPFCQAWKGDEQVG